MSEFEICREQMVVKIIVEDPVWKIQVSEPGRDEPLASFPTDKALLAGVANGFSYQVAFPEGSLTMSLDKERVSMRFAAKEKSTKTCRVDRSDFEATLKAISLI